MNTNTTPAMATSTENDGLQPRASSQAPSRKSSNSSLGSSDEDLKNSPSDDEEVIGKETPAPSHHQHGEAHITFPTAFNLYYKRITWRTSTWTLGTHKNDVFACMVLTSGWKGQKLSIHAGPTREDAVVAEMGGKSALSFHNMIELPGRDVKEEIHTKIHLKSPVYSFSALAKGEGGKVSEERFEWRQSHGKEVTSLGSKWARGWKLVRLDSSVPSSSSTYATDGTTPEISSSKAAGKRTSRDVGEASDGNEVVAVWADYIKLSKRKQLKFSFIGSGADHQLGEVFEIMAVATGLRIWQILRIGTSGGSVGGGSSKGESSKGE